MLGPFLDGRVGPILIAHLGLHPVPGRLPSQVHLQPANLILPLVVVPIMASIGRELFTSMPTT